MGDPVSLAVMTIASAGLSAASQGMQAEGTAAADQFKAQQLDEAAKYGELKATQTGAAMTRNLVTTLGNLDAVRAAAHTDPTSPTGGAVRENVEALGNEQRGIKVAGIEQQVRVDESNAAYMREAGSQALLGGDIAIAGTLLKSIGGAAGGFGGGKPLGMGGIGSA